MLHPYRVNDLRTQKERVKLPRGEGLLFDEETAGFLSRTWDIIDERTSFRQGDPIIEFDDLPGLVYLFGGVSPGNAWYNRSVKKSCFSLKISSLSDRELSRSLILMRGKPRFSEELKDCMKERGIDIDRYEVMGGVESPFAEEGEGDSLKVLARPISYDP